MASHDERLAMRNRRLLLFKENTYYACYSLILDITTNALLANGLLET